MTREELGLPWKQVDKYDFHLCGKYGREVLSVEDIRHLKFVEKAVNTYHDREELIRELLSEVESSHDTISYSISVADLIQKAKGMIK